MITQNFFGDFFATLMYVCYGCIVIGSCNKKVGGIKKIILSSDALTNHLIFKYIELFGNFFTSEMSEKICKIKVSYNILQYFTINHY